MRFKKCTLNGLLFLLLLVASLNHVHAQVTSTWNGTTGNWSDATKWDTNPLFPNNGNGSFDYNAVIGAGTVTLDQNIVIEDFVLSGGEITGSSDLTSNGNLIWTEGTFSGTGVTTLHGGSISGLASKSLAERTVRIADVITWTESVILRPTLQSAKGTVEILNGASLVAGGSGRRELDADVVINSGGTFLANGPFGGAVLFGDLHNDGLVELSVDKGFIFDGGTSGENSVLSGNGDFLVGPNAFLLVDLASLANFQFTGRIILDGGFFDIVVNDGSTLFFPLPDTLAGNGTFRADVLINSTEIAPGNPLADRTGELILEANYEQTSTGKLSLEIDSSAAGDFDTLDITGTAMLGGTAEIVVADESLLPAGTMIEVLTSSNLMGTRFDEVVTTGTEDIFLAPVYSGSSVFFQSYADGDMDRMGDGLTINDVADFALALTDPDLYRYGPSPGFPFGHGISGKAAGDLDDDGDLDVDDINLFAMELNMSLAELTTQIQLYSTRVPEPGCFVLGLAASLIACSSLRPFCVSSRERNN